MNSVLITGGTGSFGRAFVRRVLTLDTRRICIFSRGEHAQAAMREEFENNDRLRWFIGDVRDRDRLRRAMEGVEVVVAAAALKRIETGFYNPIEMCKTNVTGAINTIEAAMDAGVKKVVALSSDKAVNPVSPYGYSKAMAESLFLSANNTTPSDGPAFTVTRYGNVAGSAGSLIPKWRDILKHSDTVPVTDPDATRFWMFMSEAVDLVICAIEKMPRTLVIPELPAFRLGDLALAMNAKMEVVGLPNWEKKHESLMEGMSSDKASRMNVEELKAALERV